MRGVRVVRNGRRDSLATFINLERGTEVKKLIILNIALVVFLTGCSKSVDYYISNEEEAYARVAECQRSNDLSEDCQNANKAVILIKEKKLKAEALAREAAVIAKKKAYEAEFSKYIEELRTLSFPKFIAAYEDKTNGIRRDAARSIYDEILGKEITRVRAEVGDENITSFEEKVCRGIEKDEHLCFISRKIEKTIKEEFQENFRERVEYYINNRDKLKTTYNRCGEVLYNAAGLTRDGKWIGALGSLKLSEAKKELNKTDEFECDASVEAARQLGVERAMYFVHSL